MIDFLYRPFKTTSLSDDSLFIFNEHTDPEIFYKRFFSLGLGIHFRTFSELASYDGTVLALVPFDGATNAVEASKAEFCRVLELWQVPTAGVASLMEFHEQRGGLSHMRSGDNLYIWYSIEASFEMEGEVVRVIQTINTRTHAYRTLVLFPSVLTELMVEIPDQYLGYPDQIHWSMIHFLVIETTTKTWWHMERELIREGYASTRALDEITNKALDTQVINAASSLILKISESLARLARCKELICSIEIHANKHANHMTDAVASWANIALNNVQTRGNTFACITQSLEHKRAKAIVSMNVLSTSYTYKNMIALRRIAEQSQAEMRSTRKQADAAQASAQSMATIARIGMLYLPAASFAAIFAMPFFTIENALSFGNMNELWWYLLTVLASTLLTFILPVIVPKAWHKLRGYMGHHAVPEHDEAQEIVRDPALEPLPYVFPADALQRSVERLFGGIPEPNEEIVIELDRRNAEPAVKPEQKVGNAACQLEAKNNLEPTINIAEKSYRLDVDSNTI